MATIILQFNGIKIKEITLYKDIMTIGRNGDNDIVIGNLAVSSHHARLVQKYDEFILEDINSVNGTFVNEEKVDRCKLKNEDRILIGKHALVFLEKGERGFKEAKPDSIKKTHISDAEKNLKLFAKNLEQKSEPEKEERKERGLRGVISYISDNGNIEEVDLIKKVTIIGKGKKADIKVEGFFVGKSTLLINKESDAFYISRGDGKSSPRLNGEKIKGHVKLRDNDFIEVGSTRMHFSIRDF